MSKVKKAAKSVVKNTKKVLPPSIKTFVKTTVSDLAGTSEMHQFMQKYIGDFERYNKLLEEKSDITEYRIDKIIREQQEQIEALNRRLEELESTNTLIDRN